MAVVAKFLIDTSAAARMKVPVVAEKLAPVIQVGLVATTAALEAQALRSAQNLAEYDQLRKARRAAYEYLPTRDEHWIAALEAQRQLIKTGSPLVGVAVLLTAVIAAEHAVTVVHYDGAFDVAAAVLEFRREWIAPAGTLP
ncbi:VapC toxin family PIN domain ribonuclease [Mycobacteroides abscessus subsp. abscessus]|uniref:VapC toxin family PIN domain ribonuclease n=1 Tax=Mycobacteroides abscessus TaxID=36809 RepID=UPI00092C7212|nr:VapC toxin family PIN domain ribonuclease [Mycobacteroides abscessus]MDO2986934.1 VapC toxin family PIN domain ribonuclease [Mycobacteroides abscessus subsp. abscessus]RIS64245.1 VapC toxin family PIN domain ribonuclease [Mycobacteroides abscessus]SID32808.1 Conserved protein of uncharacterised function with PIN domain, possible toxin VapC21 [Mycobacteroides abscessus subsp. abscessus]SIJ93884.1 Conserved protein of uncharacterised function with PIN domain, possible toxin VapC21 [Mycobactero